MITENTRYVRGTATHKVTSASLQPGQVLLTNPVNAYNKTGVAEKKTGAVLRTVASTERTEPGRYERVRRVLVTFTDGSWSDGNAPSQTWMSTGIEA